MDNTNINQDPTLFDVLDAISSFSTRTEECFNNIESDISSMKGDISDMKDDISEIKRTMVTKENLDEKIADLRGDLVVMVRKEDTKFNALVSLMEKKQLLTPEEAGQFITMEPFARSVS